MTARTLVRYWMPVFVWMLVIFSASTDLGSMQQTSRFLVPFLRWLHPQISLATIDIVQLLLRKTGHLTGYAILAALLLRVLKFHWPAPFARTALLALFLATLYAVSDEFHQSFVQSRTASPWDVMIDCGGAAIGLAIYWLSRRAHWRSLPVPALARINGPERI